MNKIISDYRKLSLSTVIRFWTVTLIVLLVFWLSGTFAREKTQIAAIVMAAFMVGLSIFTTLRTLVIAVYGFKKRFDSLPDGEKGKIVEQYMKSPSISNIKLLGAFLLFFGNAKIELLRYADIDKAELYGYRLRIHKSNGGSVVVPITRDENPSAVLAALKNKNPNIAFWIDGSEVDVTKKKGSSQK